MKKKEFYSLGIMSGTSVDGLDFSLIKSDGEKKVKIISNKFYEFENSFRKKVHEVIDEFNALRNKKIIFKNLRNLDKKFTDLTIEKINLFLEELKFSFDEIDLIGIHGNTIYHSVKEKVSIQIGNPEFLAKKLNKCVVYNFRENDLLLGGQGAPLVPIFHKSIFSKRNKNVMVVNIGGISNFTFINEKKFLASDIGPGNVLLDRFCNIYFNKLFDKNGKISSSGNVLPELIEEWSKKKFLNVPLPKSFDNYEFKLKDFLKSNSFSKKDLLRTLTYFSAFIIKRTESVLPYSVDNWIICGGGSKNLTLLSDLRKMVKKGKIFTSEKFGFDSSFIESQAFAYISIRTIKKLDSSFPETTGAIKSSICGKVMLP